MAYTAEQQARIDAAQLKVTNTKNTYDAASLKLSNIEQKARDIFNKVMLCSGFKNKVKDFSILNPSSCVICLTNCGNCGGPGSDQVATCKQRVNAFNTEYNNWNAYKSTVNNALNDWNIAKQDLKDVLDDIGTEVANDPKTLAELKAIEEAEKVKMYKYIFYAVAVLVIGGITYYLLRKKKAQ